jgi:hypothetical protein
MANTFTNTSFVILSGAIIEGFNQALLPLKAFSTDISPEPAQRGDVIRVLTVPNQGTATDWVPTSGYVIGNASATGVDVTINKHKYVAWGMTDAELFTNNMLNLESFGRQQGAALGNAVMADILSIIIKANFPNQLIVGASSAFDSAQIAAARRAVQQLFWPASPRSVVLSSTYTQALFGDVALTLAYAIGSAQYAQEGKLPRYMGFDLIDSTVIDTSPADSLLVGFAVNPNAIAVAMRYLEPQSEVPLTDVRVLTNDAGMTLVLKNWYNPDFAQNRMVVECNYGYAMTQATALLRLISATE